MGESHHAGHPQYLGPWHPPTAAMVEMWVTKSSDLLSTTQLLTLQSLTRHKQFCLAPVSPPANVLTALLVLLAFWMAS